MRTLFPPVIILNLFGFSFLSDYDDQETSIIPKQNRRSSEDAAPKSKINIEKAHKAEFVTELDLL